MEVQEIKRQVINENWILPGWNSTIHVVIREYADGTKAYNLARVKDGVKNPVWCHRAFVPATDAEIETVIRRQQTMDRMIAQGCDVIEVLEAVFA